MAKAKSEAKPKLTQELIDKFGECNALRKKYEKEEDTLAKQIKECDIKPDTSYPGLKYILKVAQGTKRAVLKEKLIKKIGVKKFVEIASVTLKELANIFGKEEIDKLCKTEDGPISITPEPIEKEV